MLMFDLFAVQTGLPCAELRQPNRVLPVQYAQIILR